MPAFGYKRALGFSLIELMVAIAIIAILAGIALPSYQSYVQKSKLRAAQADVVAMSLAIENIYQRTLSYPGGAASITYDENDTDEEITALLTSWKPSAIKDVSFQLESGAVVTHLDGVDRAGYVITATPSDSAISACTVQLDTTNARKLGGSCKYGTDWF